MSEELTLLKERATAMGIAYSPNIGLEALKAKINAKLADEVVPVEPVFETVNTVTTAAAPPAREMTQAEALQAERTKQLEEQMRLVRIRITNLNPSKKDLRGEIFTVANSFVGTVRKFIPYGEETDNGYHVPFIIYNELKDRKFSSIKVRRGPNGVETVETRLVPEFALEELEPLTQKELEQLARQQAAAAGMD